MTNIVSLDSRRKQPIEIEVREDLTDMFIEGMQDVLSYIRSESPNEDTEEACEACLVLINYFQSK